MGKKRGNGEGTIVRRRDGRWMGQVSMGRDAPSGRLVRVTVYGQTRQSVAAKVTKLISDRNLGRPILTINLTPGDWLERWLRLYVSQKRPATLENYESNVRVHIKPVLGHIPMRDLRPQHIQALYVDLLASGAVRRDGGLSPRTVRLIHVILHAALRQAVREDLLVRNVADSASPPRPAHREPVPPTPEDMEQLLVAAEGHRLFALYLLYWTTGARRGELLALRWTDVDLQQGTMRIRRQLARTRTGLVYGEPKTPHARRAIPLADVAKEALREHQARQDAEKKLLGDAYADEDLVFATVDGHAIDPGNALRTFRLLLAKAGLPPYRLHDLRHAFAALLLQRGENPKVVQALLGHSSVVTTLEIYNHLIPGLTEQAIDSLNETLSKAVPGVGASGASR